LTNLLTSLQRVINAAIPGNALKHPVMNGLLEHRAILFGRARQTVLFTGSLQRAQELLERCRFAQFTYCRVKEFPFGFTELEAEINLAGFLIWSCVD
jgi:hypothetical protein